MNRLSKIFLVVIIILTIIIIGMYMNMVKASKDSLNNTLSKNEEIFKINSAVESAGYKLEIQENGSYLLVEK